ncbi:MAG TPA: right-handed parallel beta-helix repeat-containing protein [Terriglobales bacterium]|nr:right-handed parallel beta-helix repeat-containing protein [Terriglobales bacterium]
MATNCTIYVSPSGGGNGSTASSPTTLAGANSASVAGSVICLEGGTYNLSSTFSPSHSGTATAYITWRAYGNSPANLVWTGGAGSNVGTGRQMIAINGPSYIKFIGFNLNGQQYANAGILCHGGHHILYQNLYVKNMIYSGLESSACDYMTADHNQIWHVGENPYGLATIGSNAGSGITYNQQTLFDSYSGLHSVISNNIISGQFDPTTAHTDGNGISLDLTNQSTSGATLVVNNVVYGNGGRCIDVGSTSPNYWTNTIVVNNTCYKNSLDLSSLSVRANFMDLGSQNTHFINNISYAWSGWNGTVPNVQVVNSATGTTFHKQLWYGGVLGTSGTSQFMNADPLFVNPPAFGATAGGQYANSIDPGTLGSGLTLQSGSPAKGVGVDPSTISGISSQAVADMQRYIYVDINGVARPHSGMDLGAYQSSGSTSSPIAPPTGLTVTVN